MSRLPIRVRLTAAFAAAMVVVLAAAGLFVYLRLKDDLDESIAMGLNTRVAAVADSGSAAAGAAGERGGGLRPAPYSRRQRRRQLGRPARRGTQPFRVAARLLG